MVRSEQSGLARRQQVRGTLCVLAAGRRGIWALTAAALLVTLVVVTAGCSSETQAAAGSSTTTLASTDEQTASSQSASQGTRPTGFPNGTRPSGMPGQTDSSTTETTVATEEVATSAPVTETSTTTTSLADGQYGDGIYKAGTDISSGLYKGTAAGDNSHWEISSDASGVRYVASGDPTGSFYVKITSGQYLRLNGVIIQKASSTKADPLATTDLTDGTYRVNYDIEPGWYTGTVTGTSTIGYWQISSDANGQKLVASDYPRGSFTFKVTSGQYLTLRGVTISLQ